MKNTELALKINKMIHDECKEVPHDIGMRIIELIESEYNLLKIDFIDSSLQLNKKYEITFDFWLMWYGFRPTEKESEFIKDGICYTKKQLSKKYKEEMESI